MAALQLTSENFTEEVMNSKEAVFVEFWASW